MRKRFKGKPKKKPILYYRTPIVTLIGPLLKEPFKGTLVRSCLGRLSVGSLIEAHCERNLKPKLLEVAG